MGVRRALYLVLAVLVSAAVLVPAARLYETSRSVDDVAAQLRYLRGRLDHGAAEQAQQLFPEGFFFSYALYGLAWLDVGTARPALRGSALREARWALGHLDSAAGRAPFDRGLRPKYGVFYMGWTNRLRGGIVRLAGRDAPETAPFDRDCAALARAFRADGPFLSAYPGQAWPVDSVVAVSALRLHDEVTGAPTYGPVIARWLRQARARADPATGLLPHQTAPSTTGPRGSSQSLILRFLPEVDPAWARVQYESFRQRFVTTRLGLPSVLEYPKGTEGAGDVDSGPLILGVSASATVVALGTARVNGDGALAGDLTGLAEATGAPVRLGGTRYAFGVLPIGELFLAWSASAPARTGASAEMAADGSVPAWWRLPWSGLAVIVVAACWTPVVLRRLRRGDGEVPGGRSTAVDGGSRSSRSREGMTG